MYVLYDIVQRDHGISIEGVGALYQRVISLLAIAKKYNLKYVHRKIPIGHKDIDEYTNDEWDNLWDHMFNLKSIYSEDINQNDFQKKKYSNLTHDILHFDIMKNNNTLYYITIPYDISYADDCYELIQQDIIQAYDNANSQRKLLYDKKKVNIAIHIRVWNDFDNLDEYQNYLNYNTVRHNYTAEKYITLIDKLKLRYPNSDIHIFSQNKYFDIKLHALRKKDGLIFHLHMDALNTFHHLCKADVLVLGTSSFSHLAGFYNPNTVIYIPYPHPPAFKTWILDSEL